MVKYQFGDIEVSVRKLPPSGAGEGQGVELQMDPQGHFVAGQAFGNVIEKIDRGIRVTRPDGATFVISEDGQIVVEDFVAKTVGILDLSELRTFSTCTTDKMRAHRIGFRDGGHAQVTYDNAGKLLAVNGHGVVQTINKDNELLIHACESPAS